MKISVILPIYNGELYIERTIKALLSQSYEDIELILVNDGSSDGSIIICKKFKELDERVILIDKPNGGISSARNSGLEIASGDYISFIDQDDEIHPNIYNVLLDGIQDSDLAIAGKKTQLIDKDGKVIDEAVYRYGKHQVLGEEGILKLVVNYNRDAASLHLWNCLYRARIIRDNNLKFNCKLKYGHEDTLFNLQYLSFCNKVMFVDDVVYNYFRRQSTSTSLKKNKTYIYDFIEYANVVSASIFRRYDDNRTPRIIYTYLMRLGISLFAQYSENNDDLAEVANVCHNVTYTNKMSLKAVSNRVYYMILVMINFLIKKRFYGGATRLIKLMKRHSS